MHVQVDDPDSYGFKKHEHMKQCSSIALSPSQSHIAAGDNNATVTLWDTNYTLAIPKY